MKKVIALVDCNSFYCSCERLFRPDLWQRPVGVLSNNDGCFVSLTKELKELGVKMGAPYFQNKALCDKHKVAVFSANFSLYTNISDRVMNTLFEFAPSMEIYSVDEAFLDLTGLNEEEIVDYCKKIKESVERNVGIPVGIGIGRTKVLAKLANRVAKKVEKFQGVFSVLKESEREYALNYVAIEDVWGIGRQSSLKLKLHGIHKAKDLRDFKNELIIQRELTKIGRMIQDELKEINCFSFGKETPKKKEIMCSRSFGNPVYTLNVLKESVASFTALAAQKLRKEQSVCLEIEVYIRTNPFKDVAQYVNVQSRKLESATCDTRKLIIEAFKILEDIYRPGFEYRKAAVRLMSIQDACGHQISMFGNYDSEKDLALMQTMDRVNAKEGQETLKILAQGLTKEAWYMRQTLKSKRYVSGWSELFKLK